MICCIFLLDFVKTPYSCIGIQTLVGQEDIPQVGSLLYIGLSSISNGRTLNTRISVSNFRKKS